MVEPTEAPERPAPVVRTALRAALRSFALAYGVRAAVSFLVRLPAILRNPAQVVAALRAALGNDAFRLGLFFGGYSGLYRLALGMLNKARGKQHDSNAFIAGSVAGLALFLEAPDQRMTWSHYLLARAVQCAYNALKGRGWWHFWADRWDHGDALLFMVSTAQVMYAYAIRPDTIPAAYYKFILKTGPIDEVVLQNVRRNVRGQPVDVQALNDYIVSKGGPANYLRTNFPLYLSNTVLHPQEPRWIRNALRVFMDSFGKILPLYMSLTVVPMVLFQFGKVVNNPGKSAWQAMLSAGQSTTFLAAFVALYQLFTSGHRRMLDVGFADLHRDHKLSYWLIGLFAASAIFIERKSRRSELALYTLPRAGDSLYEIMYQHKVGTVERAAELCVLLHADDASGGRASGPRACEGVAQLLHKVKHGEVGLFMLAMGAIMYFYEHEPDTLSPLLNQILDRFL